MNLEGRVEKLEAKIEEKEMDVSDISLYDINGEQVNAKILRMPTDWENGLAELPDSTEIPIVPVGDWRGIIFASEQLLNSEDFRNYKPDQTTQKDYSDVLFLRRNGIQSAVEIIYANND